jgi:hypothetical protein
MLAVQAAPMSSGGGGGGLDAAALLALAGLAWARLVRAGGRTAQVFSAARAA